MLILSAMLMLMMAQRSFDDKTGAFQERVRVAKKWVASMLVVLQEHLTACSYPPPLQLSFLTRAVSCATGGSTI